MIDRLHHDAADCDVHDAYRARAIVESNRRRELTGAADFLHAVLQKPGRADDYGASATPSPHTTMNDRLPPGSSGLPTEPRGGFVGSFIDDPGQWSIVLRGHIDATAVGRVSEHIDGFLEGTAQFLVVEARAVLSFDDELVNLLGRTQRRLGRRRGLLHIRGLCPQ